MAIGKPATAPVAADEDPRTYRARPMLEAVEPRGDRFRRRGHRARLYAWAFGLVALLVVLIALVIANTRQVKLDWVVGTGRASLVWVILAATALGWLAGIATGALFRSRTRRRRT
jgi:uncharacterized integral membrane protein